MRTKYIIIPARLSSERLPNKLLFDNTGMPLICHTISRALKSIFAQKIIVATQDSNIVDVVKKWFGDYPRVSAVLTPDFNSGTDRVAYTAELLECQDDYIVNLQGDEPEINPEHIDKLFTIISSGCRRDVVTIAADATDIESISSSVVKVVVTDRLRALYFSRSRIPSNGKCLKHVGIYAYGSGFLKKLKSLRTRDDMNDLSKDENLEQLRWLQCGLSVGVVVVKDNVYPGVDTIEEYNEFVIRQRDENGGIIRTHWTNYIQ